MKQQYTIGDAIFIFIAAIIPGLLNPAWKMLLPGLIIHAVLVLYLKRGKLYRKCFYFEASQIKYLLIPIAEIIFFDVIVDCYACFVKGYTIDAGVVRDIILKYFAVGVREENGTTFLWFVVAMMIMAAIPSFKGFEKRNLIKLSVVITVLFTLLHTNNFISYWNIYREQLSWNVVESILGVAVCILGVFVAGFYFKIVFLKTHNIFLVIMIHTLFNIVEQTTLLKEFIGVPMFAGVSILRFTIYMIATICIIRSEWNCNFWNEEFQLLK